MFQIFPVRSGFKPELDSASLKDFFSSFLFWAKNEKSIEKKPKKSLIYTIH